MKPKPGEFRLKEDSLLARMAAWKLKSRGAALVWGNTIHLYNITQKEFFENERLVKHELCHVEQYRRYGRGGFLFRYILESLRKGYYLNRFETEARQAEGS
jgi:predicted SprT family Zn-dependent metalloprotease